MDDPLSHFINFRTLQSLTPTTSITATENCHGYIASHEQAESSLSATVMLSVLSFIPEHFEGAYVVASKSYRNQVIFLNK
jgi:hypothetical protein